jgi:uncharacterized protein (DUF302 family)
MRRLALATVLVLMAGSASAADGLVRLASPYSVAETAERFVNKAKKRGLTIFKRVDHRAGAASVDMDLRPTRVVIFGNPKGGTPLMQCAQTVGIDLPMKALIWEDGSGQAWLGYNDPAYLAKRHELSDCPALAKVEKLLAELARDTVAEAE